MQTMTVKRIAIMGAMPEETDLLVADMQDVAQIILGGRTYHTGTLYGKPVIVVFSRMGKVASAATAATLINKFEVEKIIFTGMAGALSKHLNIGDVVVSSQLIQHDMDASALPQYQPFEVPLLGKTLFSADKDLIDRALTSASLYCQKTIFSDISSQLLSEFKLHQPFVYKGIIASGDRFVASKKEVEKLCNAIPGVMCVEMEGAAVAQVCYEHNIPFVACRVISDKANHSAHIDFPKFASQVACILTRGIVENLIRNI
jgi:adenosylhomocysteine nucleosidase